MELEAYVQTRTREQQPPVTGRNFRWRSGWLAIALALVGLLLLEILLQGRAYLQTGGSIFKPKAEQAVRSIVVDGLRLYPPNTVIRGTEMEIRTNQYGLRSPPIAPSLLPGELRLAIIGASTVAGAYARTNDMTFSQQLAGLLGKRHPGPVNVVNAGISGLTVHQMRLMLEKVVAPLKPRLVFVYTGFNDIAKLCKASAPPSASAVRVPHPALPSWLLIPELIRKNTIGLRSSYRVSGTGLRRANQVSPVAINAYRKDVEELARAARHRNIELVFVSSLTSYRRNMPLAEQQDLSAFALYYNKCLDLNGLYTVTDRLNLIQQSVAKANGFTFLDIRKQVPGGRAVFVDSSHFTPEGERLVAEALNRYLASRLN